MKPRQPPRPARQVPIPAGVMAWQMREALAYNLSLRGFFLPAKDRSDRTTNQVKRYFQVRLV